MVAVEVTNISEPLRTTVLDMKTFAGIEVSIYIPKSDIEIMGVIGPIDVSVDTEELFDLLKCDMNTKITKVTRLNKFVNGSKTPSAAIRLTFEGNSLPTSVSIGYMKYNVRPYNAGPLRCYNCQLFGDAAGGCTRTKRCVHCGVSHTPDSCPENSSVSCANCKGPHKASSPDCPTYKKYDILVKKRKAKAIANPNSISQISNELNKTPMQSHLTSSFDIHNTQGSYIELSQTVPSGQNSYANAVKNNKSENSQILKTLSEVQKKIIKELSETIERKQIELKNLIADQIVEKISANNIIIANCIHDVVTHLGSCKKIDKKIISKIITDHFGKSVGNCLAGKSAPLRISGRSKSNQSSGKQS